ncbi:hypothetical protein PG993_001615 [Apiospora rasikravindrae]|uniref:Uncharacterized protein n=1 Tax=Apiospora rasikravindrae TaxID=990691 RepID=A0ABR1UEL6_9PEZI
MANHSSTKTSSGKKGKKDPKPQTGSYSNTDAWICEQSTGGPWDGVDTVNADQWDTPGHGSYQHSASDRPIQGSKKNKHHKSGGKK